jgi:hypothetical protein
MVSLPRYQTGSKRIELATGHWPLITNHCPLLLAISTALNNACALFIDS